MNCYILYVVTVFVTNFIKHMNNTLLTTYILCAI